MASKELSWIKQYWRPAIAWQYMVVCLFDFIIAPSINFWFSYYTGTDYIQWDPLTLKESAFYHMPMGAIIGASAWTRGLEKIKKASALEESTVSQEELDKL